MLVLVEYKGYVWEFDAAVIAHDYANYYEDENGENYEENFKYIIQDKEELNYWLLNHMNWKDIASQSCLIKTPPPIVIFPDLNESKITYISL